MNDDRPSRPLKIYPRGWRIAHEAPLEGMLAEAALDHPEASAREHAAASARGTWLRLRWPLAFTLAIGSALFTFGAIVLLATSSGDEAGVYVQSALFLATPLLAVLSLGITYGASIALTYRWLPATLIAAGVTLAGATHVVWYRLVDTPVQPAFNPWLPLVASAITILAIGVAVILTPTFTRSGMPRAASVTLALLTGAFTAPMLTVFLFLPFGAPLLALFAITSVVIGHRQSRRHLTF